jgi:hypothetical protein
MISPETQRGVVLRRVSADLPQPIQVADNMHGKVGVQL